MKQPKLFDMPRPRKPPCKRGTLMQVDDAGGTEGIWIRFKCPTCQHITEWIQVANVTEAKRGKPCPKCNPPKESEKATTG